MDLLPKFKSAHITLSEHKWCCPIVHEGLTLGLPAE